MTHQEVDLLVVGGGINGTGIARDAQGRGLSVLLCEQGDLGCATSSASTKLIHGGLRYLEHYEFKLVRDSLSEREVILAAAPHIVRPLQFTLPHTRGLRPAWLIRLGLFIYDHLGKRKRLAGSGSVDLTLGPYGEPLVPELKKGFHYSDCSVDDSRLVILNALDASELGATILTRTRCVSARPDGSGWLATLVGNDGGPEQAIRAKAIVNAAGPWAEQYLHDVVTDFSVPSLRLVKGSHIVVPRLFNHDSAYIFQNPDGRIVFAIPYERDFTLIGTTDVDFDGDPGEVTSSADEIEYLCVAANSYFNRKITPDDVAWSYAGVRPLLSDGSDRAAKVTRDYRLDLQKTKGGAPLLSVFGGKITTYRKLAELALEKLEAVLDIPRGPWTGESFLPGGDVEGGDMASFVVAMEKRFSWLPDNLLHRYAAAYGTRILVLLEGAASMQDMGVHFGADLYEREACYLISHEWARTAEDILWRRTKRGLHGGEDVKHALDAWLLKNSDTSMPGKQRAGGVA